MWVSVLRDRSRSALAEGGLGCSVLMNMVRCGAGVSAGVPSDGSGGGPEQYFFRQKWVMKRKGDAPRTAGCCD